MTMIKYEGKAADKELRIWRPDISLEEICRTKGPSIVRTMIPCFPSLKTDDTDNKVFEDDNIPDFSFVYGVNVRTPRVYKILPFSTSYIYDEENKRGELDKAIIKEGEIKYTVPEFSDKYKIRELFLSATIKHEKNKIKISAKDIVVHTLFSDSTDEKIDIANLKKDLLRDDGFFIKQINALKIKNRVYMWLTSEDYNVNTAGDALSNIIAITNDYDALVKHIMPHRLDFINLLFLIKARYLFDTEIAQRKTAIASAKAAIMSRNMSHNLGSHVMAYLKQHLNSVQDMVRDNILASLILSPDELLTKDGLEKWHTRLIQLVESNKGMDEVALPFLVGLGKFVSYLQERQDFIATIATDYVPYFSTVNFKDFIYDELNPDLRYARHKDRIGLQPDNILLGNIARSEGLARLTNPTLGKQMADIVIKYRDFDGNPVIDSISGNELEGRHLQKIALDDMRDFTVHLPGGVVGRQAIFSIIENIIRNAAKHSKWDDNNTKNLELTFDRFYAEDFDTKGNKGRIAEKKDFVPKNDLTFWSFFKTYYAAASDINDLCIVTITDNLSFEKAGTRLENCKNLEALRTALIEPYIDNGSVTMLETNKGIKEMRISAAWMRGMDDDVKINPIYLKNDFDEKEESERDPEDHWIRVNPKKGEKNFEYKYWKNNQWINRAPVLMARACSDSPNEDYHLQYIFCLPRPKKVAVILSNNEYNNHIDNVKWFAKNDWGLHSIQSFIETTNKSYEFIVVSDEASKEKIDIKSGKENALNIIRRISPTRIFLEKQIKDIVKFDNKFLSNEFKQFSDLEIKLYKKLCNFNPKVDTIVINDHKTASHVNADKPDNVQVKEGAFQGRYLYRMHNETEVLFAEYLDHADKNTVFVEGITGNNSTDRMVRNDNIDELWLYKQLHAMKTTVGIFDERIFSKIYKKDEADIRLATQISFEDLRDKYVDATEDEELGLRIRHTATEEELGHVIGGNPRRILGDYMAIAYEKKGVSIFNLLKTKDGLDIYGFDKIETEIISSGRKYYGGIVKVGEIRRDKNGNLIISNLRGLKYDYLSIHQGLLDKIYEQFDIRHNAMAKHDFTKLFYESFSSDKKIIKYKDEMVSKNQLVYYLPKLRIHSGRSKPSFADMPQHQPFIQYAAIEHAVMDCKYSLIELLDFARYE